MRDATKALCGSVRTWLCIWNQNSTIVFNRKCFSYFSIKVLLENGWNSKRMITEGDAAIPLETTRRAFRNQREIKTKISYSIFRIFVILFKCVHTVEFCLCSHHCQGPVLRESRKFTLPQSSASGRPIWQAPLFIESCLLNFRDTLRTGPYLYQTLYLLSNVQFPSMIVQNPI